MTPHPVLKAFPTPGHLELPLRGLELKKGLKKGRPVAWGESLARDPSPHSPDLVSPLPGKITKITAYGVTIETDPDSAAEPPAPIRFRDLGPVEAGAALKRIGIAPLLPPSPGDPVIVSGFDPEPCHKLAAALWEDQRSTLEAGLRLLSVLFPGKPILTALPRGRRPLGGIDSAPLRLSLKYPWTLPYFLKKKLLKSRDPLTKSKSFAVGNQAGLGGDAFAPAFPGPASPSPRPAERIGVGGTVSSATLFLLGSVFRSGKTPRAHPVTIQNIAAQVPFGMSPAKLLSLANLTPMEGDSIVLGGLMRGIATLRPDRGLPPWVEGIFLLRKGKNRPRPMGVCRKCGRCESVCPLKLPVGVLGANPPFEWKNILKISPDLLKCPACGLCALNCPENIPLNLFRENGDRVPS